MKKVFIILLLLIAPTISRAQSIYFPPVNGQAWDTISPQSLGWCMDALDTLIDYVGDTHAKAFIILKNGKIVVEHYYGTFTVDSSWYWASAGKGMTAFLMGLAQEQGYLNIHDSLPKYLGHGYSTCSTAAEDSIRIIHQLTMTSGFDEGFGGVSTGNHCTDDSCLVCIASPGSRWSYHNAPYTITHWVLDSATGMTTNAFKIINLNSSTGIDGLFYPIDYDDVFISKARSFARFGLLISNNGIWDGDTIMHDSVYFHDMINTSQSLNLSYGYLWWLNGKASYRLPGTQFQFSGPIVPDAPADMFAALGKNDQILNIVPGMGLVMIRMGEPMYASFDVANMNNDSIWVRLNNVMCNSNSIGDIENRNGISIYPNPVDDYIDIAFENSVSDFEVELSDMLGNQILKTKNQRRINLQSLPKGIYILKIFDGESYRTGKVVKN